MPKLDVTLAGEINLDLILYGLPQKLPLERELLAKRAVVTLGSSSAICAHNLSIMGTRVGFVTKVGNDTLGDLALARLRAADVDLRAFIKAKTGATGITVVLPHQRERHILTYPGTMFEMTYRDLDLAYLSGARHFHMSSFFLHRGLREQIPRLFRRMKKAGLSTSLDTNDDPDEAWTKDGVLEETLKYVDVLMPNQREACKIAGTEDMDKATTNLSKKVPLLVVKLGQRGAAAFQRGKRINSDSVKVRLVDPIGAGDSFDAGFLFQFVRGAPIEKCLRWGNLAGAFSTTQPGGTEAFRDESAWRRFVRAHRAI